MSKVKLLIQEPEVPIYRFFFLKNTFQNNIDKYLLNLTYFNS